MTNITRWYPFEDTFDDLLKGFLARPVRGEPTEALRVRVDVREDPKNYIVLAEMPGVKKEDIHVTVDGNQIAIAAEVKRESEQKQDERVLRTERYTGKVYRAFALAQDVDQDASSAKYENGVLELVLPKKSATASRQLAIQ